MDTGNERHTPVGDPTNGRPEVDMLILLVLVTAAALSFGAIGAWICAAASDALCHRRSQLLARQPRGAMSRASRSAAAGA